MIEQQSFPLTKLLVYNVKSTGDRTHPCGTPVLITLKFEIKLLALTICGLPYKKSPITSNKSEETFSCFSLRISRWGTSVLNALEKSIKTDLT